jgi:hypothetical protein
VRFDGGDKPVNTLWEKPFNTEIKREIRAIFNSQLLS